MIWKQANRKTDMKNLTPSTISCGPLPTTFFCFWERSWSKGIGMNMKECSAVPVHDREDDIPSAEWTSVGKKMREWGMRKKLVSSLSNGQWRRGQRKSGHRLQLDVRLTVNKYCLLSLRHWSSIDRVKILSVARMEKSPNSYRGFKKIRKKWLFFSTVGVFYV